MQSSFAEYKLYILFNYLFIALQYSIKMQCCNTVKRKPINVAQYTMYIGDADFVCKYEETWRKMSPWLSQLENT